MRAVLLALVLVAPQDPADELVSTSADGYRAVDYGKLTAVLLQAIQEQQAAIDELQREVTELRGQ